MADFHKVAKYLKHPLVLVGFIFSIIVGLCEALIESGILSSIGSDNSSKILILIVNYGFLISGIVVLGGIGLSFYKEKNRNKLNILSADSLPLQDRYKVSSSTLEGSLKIIELVGHQKEGACILDFMVKNEGLADVIILSAELEVMDVVELGNSGGFDYSEIFNIDISDLRNIGDIKSCRLERNIKPGEAERFGIKLGAKNMGLGTFRYWKLSIVLNTDSGKIPGKILEIRLPSTFIDRSFTDLKIDVQRNKAPDELSNMVDILKKNGAEFSSYAVNTIADQLVWGGEAKLQCEAARALEIIGAPAKEVIPMLTEALSDPNPDVKKASARVLNHIKRL